MRYLRHLSYIIWFWRLWYQCAVACSIEKIAFLGPFLWFQKVVLAIFLDYHPRLPHECAKRLKERLNIIFTNTIRHSMALGWTCCQSTQWSFRFFRPNQSESRQSFVSRRCLHRNKPIVGWAWTRTDREESSWQWRRARMTPRPSRAEGSVRCAAAKSEKSLCPWWELGLLVCVISCPGAFSGLTAFMSYFCHPLARRH